MTACLINEQTAWELVRAVPPGLFGRAQIRVHHHPRPGAWVQVDRAARWTAATCTDDARQLFDVYLPIRVSSALTIAQTGQSLDGRIATPTGQSHYVTGEADLVHLHRLRALMDAVVVGVGTVVADNPRLTVRRASGTNPTRVIIDPRARVTRTAHIFTDGSAPTIEIRRDPGPAAGADPPSPPPSDPASTVVYLPGAPPHDALTPASILTALRARGLHRILVEGGGTTVSAFLQARALDRLHVTVAPLLIGSGYPAITLEPIVSLDEAIRPACRHFHLGSDLLFDLDLRTLHG